MVSGRPIATAASPGSQPGEPTSIRALERPIGVRCRSGGRRGLGGLIGLLFLAPLLGMAIGAAAGAAGGAMADYGVDDDFMKELGEKLTPGSAALIVLVRSMTPDKILPNIQEQGHVIQSSLSNEPEARLNEALAAAGSGTG